MTEAEFVLIIFALIFSTSSYIWLRNKYGLIKTNFKGNQISASAGIWFLLFGSIVYFGEWKAAGLNVGSAAVFLNAVFGFGLLGLCDDLYGTRADGGFRGHFTALWNGRITTGAIKAVAGGLVALVCGFLLWYPMAMNVCVGALLIALTANLLNLVDLRPGRCLFAFLTGSAILVVVLAVGHHLALGFLLYVAMGSALVLYALDAGGVLMIGDTGANAFGAVLGVSAALWLSEPVQIGLVLLLIAVHVWTEKYSIQSLIENTSVLRKLDSKIGVR